MATTRQSFIASIIRKAALGSEPIAFTPTAGLRTAVDNAGFARRTSADGKDEVFAEQAEFLAAAMESAVVSGQPQLLQAIYTAERDRRVANLTSAASNYTASKNAVDAEAAAITGTTLS